MTLKDLLDRIIPGDYDKMIILTDGIGWTNVNLDSISTNTITLRTDRNEIFSDDKGVN